MLIFSRINKVSNSFSKAMSTFIRTNKVAATLQIGTWAPSIKMKDSQGAVVSTTPMTSIEAKTLAITFNRSRGRSIDIYGHAAAQLIINLKHPNISTELFDNIKKLTHQDGIDITNLESIYGYISWFPKSSSRGQLIPTGRVVDPIERQQFINKVSDQKLREIKESALNFLGSEYAAQNSSIDNDEYMYGKLDPQRVITFENLNFNAIMTEYFNMMKSRASSDKKLVFEETRDEATYFGIDMLRRHRLLLGNEKEREPIAAEHVCTTAAMRLLEAGVGSNIYKEIVEKVIQERPDLSHGLPIVDLTHYVAKEIALRTEPQLTATTTNRPSR